MAAIYSNGGNRWNILGFNFTKRDALSSVYKISMVKTRWIILGISKPSRYFSCWRHQRAIILFLDGEVLLHAVVTKPRRGPFFAKKRAKQSVNKIALLSF
jgi:hypothetical protein